MKLRKSVTKSNFVLPFKKEFEKRYHLHDPVHYMQVSKDSLSWYAPPACFKEIVVCQWDFYYDALAVAHYFKGKRGQDASFTFMHISSPILYMVHAIRERLWPLSEVFHAYFQYFREALKLAALWNPISWPAFDSTFLGNLPITWKDIGVFPRVKMTLFFIPELSSNSKEKTALAQILYTVGGTFVIFSTYYFQGAEVQT